MVPDDAALAHPFVDHVKKLFQKEGDADFYLDYMAHIVQKPGEKANIALVICGEPGTGKDTAVDFCKPALGLHNSYDVKIEEVVEGRYTYYMESLLIKLNEASDKRKINMEAFYENLKTLITDESAIINKKGAKQYKARSLARIVIITNHYRGGFHIPKDDRRLVVLQCATKEEMGISTKGLQVEYFNKLRAWYDNGGNAHIYAYLLARDIQSFNPHSHRETEAWRDMIIETEAKDEWMLECIDELGELGEQGLIIGGLLVSEIEKRFGLPKHKARGVITPALMERCGYESFNNPDRKGDGLWWINDGKGGKKKVKLWKKIGTKPTKKDVENLVYREPF